MATNGDWAKILGVILLGSRSHSTVIIGGGSKNICRSSLAKLAIDFGDRSWARQDE